MPFAMNMSRADAVNFKKIPVNTVIVSITDPDRQIAFIPSGYSAMIRFQFSDIGDMAGSTLLPPGTPTDAIVFTDEMASQLATFLKSHQGKNFVAHCEAGVSRSGAVVETILEVFEGYADWGGPRFPNSRVKRLLKKALGVEPPLFQK
jgi:predicted protein tyrosine phosphatase